MCENLSKLRGVRDIEIGISPIFYVVGSSGDIVI